MTRFIFVALVALLCALHASADLCDGVPIDIDASSNVTINGTNVYVPNCVTVWRLTAPLGSVLRLDAAVRLLISSDRVLFYDGGVVDPARRFGAIFGEPTVPFNRRLYSPGNVVTIQFTTDSLPKIGQAFVLTANATAPIQHCSGLSNTVPIGTAISEPVTWGVGASYALGATCGWLIDGGGAGGSVVITLLTGSDMLPGHTVQIFDGPSTSYPLLLVANKAGATTTASGSTAYVLFTSTNTLTGDSYPNTAGFRLNTTIVAAVVRSCLPLTYVNVTAATTAIATSFSPDVAPAGLQCAWLIDGSSVATFSATGPWTLNLDPRESISIYDGSDTSAPLLGAIFGTVRTVAAPSYTSSGGRVFVVLNMMNYSRWDTTSVSLPFTRVVHTLVTNTTASTALNLPLKFPPVPGAGVSYLGVGFMRWDFLASLGNGVWFNFANCSLGSGDTLEVIDHNDTTGEDQVTCSFTGAACAGTCSSTTRNVSLVLTSTHAATSRRPGFTTAGNVIEFPLRPQCDVDTTLLGEGGYLAAPKAPTVVGTPRYTAYAPGMVCRWNVTCTQPGCRVDVVLKKQDIGPGAYLHVYGSWNNGSDLIYVGDITGSPVGAKDNVVSPYPTIVLVFDTTAAVGYGHTGFEAQWTYRKGAAGGPGDDNPYDQYPLSSASHDPVINVCQYQYHWDPSQFSMSPRNAKSMTFVTSANYTTQPPDSDLDCVVAHDFVYYNLYYIRVNTSNVHGWYAVYDGPDTNAPILAASNWSVAAGVIGVSGWITIHYRGSILGRGAGLCIETKPYGGTLQAPVYLTGVQSPPLYVALMPLYWSQYFNLYTRGQEIQYLFSGQQGGFIRLTHPAGVYGGLISIYDGPNATSPLLYRGSSDAGDWVTTQRTAYVTFSGTSSPYIGATNPLSYMQTARELWCSALQVYELGQYDHPLRALSIAQTYGFYPGHLLCGFLLRAPPGQIVRVDLTVDVGAGSSVQLFDGRDSTSPLIALSTTGVFYSTGREAFLLFNGGGNHQSYCNNGMTFKSRAMNVDSTQYCQGETNLFVYQSRQARIDSPLTGILLAGRYPVNSNCTFNVQTELGASLRFTIVSETETQDFVEVYDGFSGLLIYRASGLRPTAVTVTSACNKAVVRFFSNGVSTAFDRGFAIGVDAIQFTVVPPLCRPSLATQFCRAVTLRDQIDLATYNVCSVVMGNINFTANPSIMPLLEVARGNILGPALDKIAVSAPILRFTNQITWPCNASFPNIRESSTITVANCSRFNSQSLEFATDLRSTNLALREMNISNVLLVGNFGVTGNSLLTRVITPSRPWQIYSTFNLLNNPSFRTMDFSSCVAIQSFGTTSPIEEVVFHPSLSYLGSIFMCNAPLLKRFSAPGLVQVDSGISFANNALLAALDFPNLLFVGGAVTIQNNAVLASLRIPKWQFGLGDIKLGTASFALQTLDISSLQGATWLEVKETSITTLLIPQLLGTAGYLTVTTNTLLRTLTLCSLTSALAFTSTGNPLLSCADLVQSGLSHANIGTITSTDCSGAIGVFTCNYNYTTTVPVTCRTTTCIQAVIAVTVTDRMATVYVPTGVYTGCNVTTLNMLGKHIRLLGDGVGRTIIDCQGIGRALIMTGDENANTVIQGIEFRNGSAPRGGLIYVAGNAAPILSGVALSGGVATEAGGALAIDGGAAPFLNDIHVTNSRAPIGGGIVVAAASPVITSTVIDGNTADTEGGGVAIVGAAYLPPLLQTGVVITNNVAQFGGGLYADAAFSADDTTFSSNTAQTYGGGIALVPAQELGTSFNFTSTTVGYNTAGGEGGGVFAFSADLLLRAVTVADNSASGNGGGLLATCSDNYQFLEDVSGACGLTVVAVDTLFSSNVAGASGGASLFEHVAVSMLRVNASSNHATIGGAFYATASSLNIVDSTLTGNGASENGGGVYCEPFTGNCSISRTRVMQNQAVTAGAGVYLCVSACPLLNSTTAAVVPFSQSAPLVPDLAAPSLGNVFENGEPGYGSAAASDVALLAWDVMPSAEIISGRSLSNNSTSPRLTLLDAFQQRIVYSPSILGVALTLLRADGLAGVADEVVFVGAATVLVSGGVAQFDGLTIVAANLSTTNASYIIRAEVPGWPTVSLDTSIYVRPCAPGEGMAGGGQVTCVDCTAGTAGSGRDNYTCNACLPGTYASDLRPTTCTPCPLNTFAPASSAVSCLACPSGYITEAEGAVECIDNTPPAAAQIVDNSLSNIAVPLGASLGVLLVLAILLAFIAWRVARRRTLRKYYLDTDSTVRAGDVKSPLQRDVENLIISSGTTRIGGGVYADVYRARYRGRWIALKVLKTEMIGNTLALDEFQRETVALNRLNACQHPGVVKLQFFLQKRPLCIGMEFCMGGSVKAAITKNLADRDRVRIAAEAASAIAVLHDLNIAHLDIKTDNLLLDENQHVKLADFGISRTVDGAVMPNEFIDGSVAMLSSGSDQSSAVEQNNVNPVFGAASDVSPDLATRKAPPATHMSTIIGGEHFNPLASDNGSAADSSVGGGTLQGMARRGTQTPSTLASVVGMETVGTAYTPQYVDPMRIEHDRMNDIEFLKQADVFSFSLVLWAVMSGEEPYAGEPIGQLLKTLKSNPSHRPPAFTRPCSPVYERIMTRCWEHNRVERMSCRDALGELASLLRNEYGMAMQEGYNPGA